MSTPSLVLVTGATGFVGARLVPALIEQGYAVRAMTRRPDDYDGPAQEAVRGDVHDPDSLTEALEGVDVAIYLVHSLDDDDFESKDAEAARNFGKAAAKAGCQQIVYLGGLGSEEGELSPHLRSRREVEGCLSEAGVPVTTLRAAIVVGRDGISWEITRQLVKNLPAMVVPQWVQTRTQPIALTDVVRYLVAVVGSPIDGDRVFEIGGPEVLTYREMMQIAAEEMLGRKLPIIPAPVLTPRLSSRWISLVTDVDHVTARNLIDSMSTEVVVENNPITALIPDDAPLSYRQAVRLALGEQLRDGPDQG